METVVAAQMGTIQRIQLLVAGPRLSETCPLHQLLTHEQAIEQAIVVVGETPEISRVPRLARMRGPDVVMLRSWGTEFALESILLILTDVPEAKLLVVANIFSIESASLILVHGARGVLAVDDLHTQGIRAIRAVHAGEIWGPRAAFSRVVEISSKQTMRVDSQSRMFLQLTERERTIATMLGSGASNKEIASELNISHKTVKTHLHNIYGKLHIHRRQKIAPAINR